ncbi:MAG TPA: hypothetical protein VGM34_00110, partial [Chlamydiales bacterium]
MATIGVAPRYAFFQQHDSMLNGLFTGDYHKEISWEHFKAADRDAGFLACWARRALRVVAIAIYAIPIFLGSQITTAWDRWIEAPALKRKLEMNKYATWFDLKQYRAAAGKPLSSDKITELRGGWHSGITVDDVQELIGMLSNLFKLSLYADKDNQNPETLFELGRKFPQVSDVQLAIWSGAVNALIPSIALSFPKLRSFHVTSNTTNLTKEGSFTESNAALIMLATHCPALRSMTLPHASVDRGIVTLAEKLPDLRRLEFPCGDLSDLGLQAIGEKLANLQYLNVEINGSGITDKGLRALAGVDRGNFGAPGCRKLKNLNLSHSLAITNQGVEAILAHCQALEVLNLRKSHLFRGITGDILNHRILCQNLRELNLEGIPDITYEGITHFASICPKLTKLIFSRNKVQL